MNDCKETHYTDTDVMNKNGAGTDLDVSAFDSGPDKPTTLFETRKKLE